MKRAALVVVTLVADVLVDVVLVTGEVSLRNASNPRICRMLFVPSSIWIMSPLATARSCHFIVCGATS
jgi:hypothetical protein